MDTKSQGKLIERLGARLRELRDANGANVTVTFALATVPMIGFVGAAVDYSHANAVRSALQGAADSTALMLAKEASKLTTSELETKGNAYFKAIFTRPDAKNLALNFVYSTTGGSKVTVKAAADVKTEFMQLMGFQNLKVAVDSMARWGTTKLQVALALDTTGSMAWDNKMPALKTAAKELLTTLQSAASNNGDIQVAIVPFAKYVRIDPNNWNQTWIDWEDWDDDNGQDSSTTTCTTTKTGKSGKKKKKCSTTTTWVPDQHNTWNGCLTDRDQDHDVKNTTPNPATPVTLFPAEQANDCPARMMGLSHNWTQLKQKIDELQPNGMTNQGIGLAWAWMALTPTAPLSPPAKTADMQQAIILFSDGQNTENRWWDDQAKIDARQALACANAKAAGITIYTVLVMAGTSNVMKNCASKPEYYFEISTANQTVTAFNAIGTSLTKLRLAE